MSNHNYEDLIKLGLAPEHTESAQQTLFDVEPDWTIYWWGMPNFTQKDAYPNYQISMNFMTFEDVLEFAKRLNLQVTSKTNSLWFPPQNLDQPSNWEYIDES